MAGTRAFRRRAQCFCLMHAVQEAKEFPDGRRWSGREAEGDRLSGDGVEDAEPRVAHGRRFVRIEWEFPLERAVRLSPAPDVRAEMGTRADHFGVGVFQARAAGRVVKRA